MSKRDKQLSLSLVWHVRPSETHDDSETVDCLNTMCSWSGETLYKFSSGEHSHVQAWSALIAEFNQFQAVPLWNEMVSPLKRALRGVSCWLLIMCRTKILKFGLTSFLLLNADCRPSRGLSHSYNSCPLELCCVHVCSLSFVFSIRFTWRSTLFAVH